MRPERKGDLLGPYEWTTVPSVYVGLAAVVAGRGPDHSHTRLMALHQSYRRQVPALLSCLVFRVWGLQLGLCTRRRGHEPPCRILLLSAIDSERITSGARRAGELDPIPGVGA